MTTAPGTEPERSGRFRDYTFGYVSAETELARDPRLLTEGFLNVGGIVNEVLFGERFLVLGNKGSGKSATAEHLKLSANEEVFITSTYLSDFPYSDLKRFVDSTVSDQSFPTAWSWLLLVTLFNSFLRDQGGNAETDQSLADVSEALRTIGFLSTNSLRELLVVTSQKRHLRLELPLGFRIDGEETSTLDYRFPFFVAQIKTAMLHFRSSSRHILILDGLDDVLNVTPIQFESLAALILESLRLNDAFRQSHVNAKIVLLCPTDLFERLPGRNTNKVRQDYALRLNWYTPESTNSLLWRLVNLRASLQAGRTVDVLKEHLPDTIQRSARLRTFPINPSHTGSYLLRFTRQTPRDFIQMMSFIQKYTHTAIATAEEIESGLREYATHYFIAELRDELGGYFRPADISELFKILGTSRKGLYSFDRLIALTKGRFSTDETMRQMLEALFDCSAIGNWERDQNASVMTFRYKYNDCRLNTNEPIVLHPALSLALNTGRMEESATRVAAELPTKGELIGEVISLRREAGMIRAADGTELFFSYKDDLRNPTETRLVEGDTVLFRPRQKRVGMIARAKDVHLAPAEQRNPLDSESLTGKIAAVMQGYGFIDGADGRKFYFGFYNLVDPNATPHVGSKVMFARLLTSKKYPYLTATKVKLLPSDVKKKKKKNKRNKLSESDKPITPEEGSQVKSK